MKTLEKVPYDKNLDNTLSLMLEGYLFIKNRVDRYSSNLFQTRLMMQNVICMSGKEAAEIFYDPERFQRHNAAHKRVQKTLLGLNAIQTMDGDSHNHRKQVFLSLMTPHHQKRLVELAMERWQSSIPQWEEAHKIVLFDEAQDVLCQIACSWAGVPLDDMQIKERASDFGALIDSFGAVGPRYWEGRKARIKTEKWLKEIIKDVRTGKLKPEKGSALHAISYYKDPNGKQLDIQMAAVELINVLRPIVAIATYITFAATALHEHPECTDKLRLNTGNYIEWFVQEIRRYYPFTPFIGARVRKDFIWNQCHFSKGTLVLLDAYGTNHDSRIWHNPNDFQPERFKKWKGSLFDFIPQGGGKPSTGHRCPGEGITVAVIKTSLDFLVNKIEYEVPKQDLSYNLAIIPTLPESGFVMTNIKGI